MSKFSPRPFAAWLAFCLFLASCGKDNRPLAPRNAADLTIHAASDEAVPGWNVMKFWDDGKGEIWIEPSAALTLDDIQSAEQKPDGPGTAIALRFTAAGAEKLHKFSSENIGKKAAIVFEGKVINAPVIMAAINSNVIINTGPSGLSSDQSERILAIVNH
jgi:preprotein translocase subunit SecD